MIINIIINEYVATCNTSVNLNRLREIHPNYGVLQIF